MELHQSAGERMVKTTTKTLCVALLSLAASTAVSQNYQGQDNDDQGRNNNYQGQTRVSAPEIDPAQALGALTLLGGAVAIIRGYLCQKK
jgi:hypothetical protein